MDTLESLGKPLRDLRNEFEETTIAIRPALWRYCLRLTGSPWDAEDLVQETLVKGFARLTVYWQPLDPKPYLFRIATNTWIDAQRRAKLFVDSLDEVGEVKDEGSSPGETWAAMETLVTLLPPRQRVIVLLADVFDFTAREVAAMIGTTEGAVKAALHRARNSLQVGGGTRSARSNMAPANEVIARYLQAFNRRDPDAVASLLSEDVTSDIIGVGEELGRHYTRKYSLTEWATEKQFMWAEAGQLDGRDVVFVFFRTPEHERALAWIITVDVVGEQITTLRTYCFCPDLIQYAADLLGVPAFLVGYRYQPPVSPLH